MTRRLNHTDNPDCETSGYYIAWLAHLLFWPALFGQLLQICMSASEIVRQNMTLTGDPCGMATLLMLHLLHRSTIILPEVPFVSGHRRFHLNERRKGQAYVRKEKPLCSNPHA